MTAELHVRAMDTDHCTAFWHNVYLHLWRGTTTMAAARGIAAGVVELLDRHPHGIAVLGVSRPSAKTVPEPEVRQFLAELFRRHGDRVLAIASAVQGEGFMVAAKRTAMATISMLARQPAPLRIFATEHEAADWLAARVPRQGAEAAVADELVHAFSLLEQRYDAFLASS